MAFDAKTGVKISDDFYVVNSVYEFSYGTVDVNYINEKLAEAKTAEITSQE